jgi:hypothetical protein
MASLVAGAAAHNALGQLSGIGDALAGEPGAVLATLDLMAAEARKKRRSDKLIDAFGFMLGEALLTLRFGVENGHPGAAAQVAAVQERVAALLGAGELGSALAVLILRQFASARLNPGEAVLGAIAERRDAESVELPPERPDGNKLLAEMAQGFGGDMFAFQAQIVEQGALWPEAGRAGIPAALLSTDDPALREVALGWLLDPAETTRRDTAGLLQQAAASGRLGGIALRRLIGMRNWLPPGEKPAVDEIIRSLRRKGVEPAPLAPFDIRQILVTGMDGAGARSLFLLVKDGRKQALLSVLIKIGIGIADAWTRPGLSKAEADRMRQRLILEAGGFENNLAFVRTSLAHGLALGLEAGSLPAFWLVDVIERAGLSGVNPERLRPDELVARLVADIPAMRLDARALGAALKTSATWQKTLPAADSWFEDNPTASTLLDQKRLSFKQRVALILEDYLPTRRRHWAETFAWNAFAAQRGELHAGIWEEVALVARELLSDRPLSEIPVMSAIASRTVEAWEYRRDRARHSARE